MILIKNVNILTMTDNNVRRNQYILIKDGIISAIGSSLSLLEDNDNTILIDGTDKYVMPGLINMHTHLGDNQDDLMLYLVNGVTTIRNMWGYEGFRIASWLFGTRVFNHLKLKKEVEQGIIEGPSIYTVGSILDGDPPVFPKYMYLHALNDMKQIQKVIKKQVDQGYDFIKIYHALSRQNFDDITFFTFLYIHIFILAFHSVNYNSLYFSYENAVPVLEIIQVVGTAFLLRFMDDMKNYDSHLRMTAIGRNSSFQEVFLCYTYNGQRLFQIWQKPYRSGKLH